MKYNESEKLMHAIGRAVSDWYKANGRVDERGRAVVDPHQLMNVYASIAGAVISKAPTPMRSDVLTQFVRDAALHAGFSVEVNLRPMQ